jgi:hypothetical protein
MSAKKHVSSPLCDQFHAPNRALLVNKQLNDKERVAAALENPSILRSVEQCLETVLR